MTNEDLVKEIALWALGHFGRRNEIGDHFDMTDDDLIRLFSWLKEDIELTKETP
tara:strand:- start:9 stop:170 length:162 start_codon:yes stop_codon:yes gene_type:complete